MNEENSPPSTFGSEELAKLVKRQHSGKIRRAVDVFVFGPKQAGKTQCILHAARTLNVADGDEDLELMQQVGPDNTHPDATRDLRHYSARVRLRDLEATIRS